MMKSPWVASQSRIVCIHESLLGTAPLRTSALSWSIIQARRVFTAWTSASALCRYKDSARCEDFDDQQWPHWEARENQVALYVLSGSGRLFVDLLKEIVDVTLYAVFVH